MNRSSSRTRRYGHLHEIREINVMPLVDLLLQMFIAVVIFFPVVEYGMNINLPLAQHPLSFLLILFLMVVVAGGMLLYFRKRRWL